MSNDMAIAVLQRAHYQIGRLEMPLEIEVQVPRWGKCNEYQLPFLVVDEAAQFHSRNWHMLDLVLSNRDWKRPQGVDIGGDE